MNPSGESKSVQTDFLVLGSGVAGLRAAIELAPHGTVLIVNKGLSLQSATGFAQGGIAAAMRPEDSWETHFEDTLRTGKGLCRRVPVEILVRDGPERIKELVAWGAEFDREGEGYSFAREGAHSLARILHAGGDATGAEILRTLSKRAAGCASVTQWENCFSQDLLVRDGECCGAVLRRDGGTVSTIVHAAAVLVATGGAGQLYARTTNPAGASGDGMAMAYRAGAILADMEFVQFHPTALKLKGAPPLLLTEAMRGEGARLLDSGGHRFMTRYHPDAELAPRDVTSRAILAEMEKAGADHVFLDISHLEADYLKRRFPTIYRTCKSHGLDITRTSIPVSPGAHFMIGGVETDPEGRTSIPGLFAAGEVAANGVHGANRLASNSLLEGLVFGARAGAAMAGRINSRRDRKEEDLADSTGGTGLPVAGDTDPAPLESLPSRLADLMWREAGIVRSETELKNAVLKLKEWESRIAGQADSPRSVQIANLLTVARLIARAALERRESRGVHYRSDFPDESPDWERRHIRLWYPDSIDTLLSA